jgi:hypothetical protein
MKTEKEITEMFGYHLNRAEELKQNALRENYDPLWGNTRALYLNQSRTHYEIASVLADILGLTE